MAEYLAIKRIRNICQMYGNLRHILNILCYFCAETGPEWPAHQLRAPGPLLTGRQVLPTPRDNQEALRASADATAATRAVIGTMNFYAIYHFFIDQCYVCFLKAYFFAVCTQRILM